jgi:hypothetical protein
MFLPTKGQSHSCHPGQAPPSDLVEVTNLPRRASRDPGFNNLTESHPNGIQLS